MKSLLNLLPRVSDLRGNVLFQILLLYLVFSQIYYSYRYFFSFGSSRTSPTAADTPLELQLPRYLITLAFYALVLGVVIFKRREIISNVTSIWRSHRKTFILGAVFLAYLSFGILKFPVDFFDFAYKELIKTAFFIPIALIPLLITYKEKILTTLLKFLNLSLIFQILGFIAVYIGFVVFGKPPAQAYPESMTRFGGIWDDPNALAAFLLISLFTYLSLPREIHAKYAKWIYGATFLISVMLFLALSLTSWIIMVGGLFLISIIRKNKFVLKNTALILVTFIVLAIISPYSKNFLEFKAASLAARVYQTLGIEIPAGPAGAMQPSGFGEGYVSDQELIANLTRELTEAWTRYDKGVLTEKLGLLAIGRGDRPIFSENFYITLLFNYGLLGVVLFVSLLATILRKSYKAITTYPGIGKYIATLTFVSLSALAVGLTSLPYLSIFPVGVYFWLIISLFLAARNSRMTGSSSK